ncbi:centrosomal protein of 55 kDa-like isoform X2 [Echeneis naucrates]|uniref:centrosomal protein of 55 kDa-like isoform X2 n=1 Tax=Echeneis naucrates TaxID=173247 RepID=UPI001114220B|nr:centrosomal protein of 55 kDa-like isoform X2 [Echeneis naucrates]
MATPKYKGYLKKKRYSEPKKVVSNLRKENAYLKKTLVELSRRHSEYYSLVKGFLSLESVRLENLQQMMTKDDETALLKGEHPMDVLKLQRISVYTRELEEVTKKLVCVATKCQSLKNKVTGKKALEKNKQWLEYDQQREAYVRAVMGRMLWLENQLNEANQAFSKQHNEEHSVEKERILLMQEYYERLLQKAKSELHLLREQVDSTYQKLVITQNWCKESKMKVEELKKLVHIAKMSNKTAPEEHHWSEDEEQRLRDETKDLHCQLDAEKRRSANFELQANILQKYMLNLHRKDQEKIADLERQIKISLQDLEDERQDCSYLKKQMTKVLKSLQKTKDDVTEESKRDHQSNISCKEARPSSQLPRDRPASATHSLNESYLECPGCQAQYPVSHHRELMNHLDICLD